MGRGDPVLVIERAYSRAPDCESWLQGIADAVLPSFDQGLGVQVYAYDMRQTSRVLTCATAGPTPINGAGIESMLREMPLELVASYHAPGVRLQREALPSIAQRTGIDVKDMADTQTKMFQDFGIYDVIGVGAGDPSRVGCIMTFPAPGPIRLAPGQRRLLSKLSAHIAAGYRLRYAPPEPHAASPEEADAVLGKNGELLHAETPDVIAARRALAHFVNQSTAARGKLRRSSAEQAVELWQALVQGEWSVVEHVDSDGKRLMLVRRNRPAVGDPGALTLRERQIVAYAALGHSQKFIAYELGLGRSTVSHNLQSALKKLRLRHRSELSKLFGKNARKRSDR